MTLIVTEITQVGIVMITDSAITKMQNNKIVDIDNQGWQKLLKVPKIKAGIAYWGMIGAITSQRFDSWLQNKIDKGGYTDLNSFANCLVDELNKACKNQPMNNGNEVGIHVAGYSTWSDGVVRPTFYHIHNGHGRYVIQTKKDQSGAIISYETK
jgi:hypothetical protein